MSMGKIKFIDLFAGCGGLSEGFLQTGNTEALAHVEWELPMVNTLRNRLVNKWGHSEEEALKRVIHFDIQKTDELLNGAWHPNSLLAYGTTNHESVIRNGLKGLIKNQKVDLIIGGPPCQAYSIAGRAQDKNSMKLDYRNYLFESFLKIVEDVKPTIFIFENVPGLLSAKPKDRYVTELIYEAFYLAGFEIRKPKDLKKAVYDASDFNVPQKRNRIIIVGIKRDTGLNLEQVYDHIEHNKNQAPKRTVRDAIAHLPKIIPLDTPQRINGRNISHIQNGDEKVRFHVPRFHNNRDIEIFRKWIGDQMNSISSDQKIAFYNYLMGKKSNHAKYRNLEWDKPSPTIVAHLYKDGLMFIHPDLDQARSITIKEAALLQSFPPDYDFVGSFGDCYKMIGNAVPPEMARRLAEGINGYFNNNGKES